MLGFSAQAYFAWLADPISTRELKDAYLTNALIDAHGDDPEFGHLVRRAVDLVRRGEQSVPQIAKDLGISESCLRRWVSIDDVDSGRKEGVSSDERRELVELRRRNRVLEVENEILKRASPYFARENVLPNRVPAGV